MTEIKRRGLMLVLSSPSGAGKTTLTRRLLEVDPLTSLSISATTRARRPSELEGRDYQFVDAARFEAMVKANEFLEHAEVFGNRYGTPKKAVLDALGDGRDVIFDVDWQGAKQLRRRANEDVVSIFILPPSHDELERRLTTRAEDTPEVVAGRMAKAGDEIKHWEEYDYVVVNRDVATALSEIRMIVGAERLKRGRQIGLTEFVKGLT
jgi:guanylate kinase